jgi:phosphoserine / homoserine phosphotransferase
VVDYRLRIPNQKQRAVSALRDMNYHVIAAGDSFNDTAMLAAANVGIFFRAPVSIQKQFPQFDPVETYSDLMSRIEAALNQQ